MKRLIICLDGTWNAPDNGAEPTNVVKMMRAIRTSDDKGVAQVTFYDRGVGTGGPIDKLRGGVFGKGLDENVQDGYRFLVNNHQDKDEVYLFGFSRGAYTARSLAGFLGRVGLIKKMDMRWLPDLWQFYKGKPIVTEARKAVDAGRKKVPIRCVGVWDTVGAMGVPVESLRALNSGKFQFHDTNMGGNVDIGLHAIAIDEKRGPFAPTFWKQKARDNQLVEQVWFPGVHSNIGGSYDDPQLSDLALEWMIRRLQATSDLAFDDAYISDHIDGKALGTIYESRTMLYSVSKALPFIRLIGQNTVPVSWLRKFFPRTITNEGDAPFLNEMIHQCAIDRFSKMAPVEGKKKVYRPATLAAALENPRHPLKVVGYDGDYNGNPFPPKS